MDLNQLQIKEKLNKSDNEQETNQSCFSDQQNAGSLINQPSSNNINYDVYGVNLDSLKCRNIENQEDENSFINSEGKNSLIYYQRTISMDKVIQKLDMTQKPEYLRLDENNHFCSNILNNIEIKNSLINQNDQKEWDKDLNSCFEVDSNDLFISQQKFSHINLISNQEELEKKMSEQYQTQQQRKQQFLDGSIGKKKQENYVQDKFELNDRHKQKLSCVLQQEQPMNQCIGGNDNQILLENNQNNIKQVDWEKNQNPVTKKRKSTQQTLVMCKQKKFEHNVPSFTVLSPNQNQLINGPLKSFDSSNSNDKLQLHQSPPAGNLKITQFFQKNSKIKNRSFTSNISQDDLQDSNQQYQENYLGYNNYKNQKENIISLEIPSNEQKMYLSPQIQNSNNLINLSKKSIFGNNKQNDRDKLSGQNIINSQSQLSSQKSLQTPNNESIVSQQYSAQQRGDMNANNLSNISKIQQQNQILLAYPKLELKYNSLQEDLQRKNIELKEKHSIIKYLEQDKREIENVLQNLDKDFEEYQSKVKKIVQFQLLENEKLKREELRQIISNDKQRLGEFIQTRDCTKFEQIWQEGIEFKKIKDRFQVIQIEKEDLEKKKKNIKGSRKSNNEPELSQDYDIFDIKQRINIQVQFLQKEEQDLLESQKALDDQKFLYLQKVKRYQDEQNSKYGQSWSCLGDRYQLLSLLGRGGFSEVYKAYDLKEFRDVACKIHSLNANWSESSKANYIKHAVRESKIHAKLKHPNIVQLFDIVEIDNNSFSTILEFCEGPDLHFYLKKNKILQEKEAKMLIKQILCALKYMNSQSTRIIHYDLKPQNIIFHKGELKISDFGLSKIFEDGQTRMELTSQGVGTYWYLPPETFEFDNNPQISPKVDVWSVGVIFFEMVFGLRPFGNNKSQEQILKVNSLLN